MADDKRPMNYAAPWRPEKWRSAWCTMTGGSEAQHDAMQPQERLLAYGKMARDSYGADGAIEVLNEQRQPVVLAVAKLGSGAGGTVYAAGKPEVGFASIRAGRVAFKVGNQSHRDLDEIAPSSDPIPDRAPSAPADGYATRESAATLVVGVRGEPMPGNKESLTDQHGRARGMIVAYKTVATVHEAFTSTLDSLPMDPWDKSDVARMLVQVGGSLEATSLEGRPVVHHDIKGGNILWRENPTAGRIDYAPCDLDIAAGEGRLVRVGRGTRTHAAPEQYRHDGSRDSVGAPMNRADSKVDGFALSAVASEALRGKSYRQDAVLHMTNGETRPAAFAVERQPGLESGYRDHGDAEWDTMLAAGAHPDPKKRTPRIGLVAQAVGQLDNADRDVILSNDKVLRAAVGWLARPERQEHEWATAHLDSKAMTTLLSYKELPADLRQTLTKAQERVALVAPNIRAEFLAERIQAEDKRQHELVEMFSRGGDVVKVEFRNQPTGAAQKSMTQLQSEAKAKATARDQAGAGRAQRDRWGPGP